MKPYVVLVLFYFLFTVQVFSQVHFPFGTYVYRDQVGDSTVKNLGINTIVTNTGPSASNKSYLEKFDKSIALNIEDQDYYIHNYTLGYYKIWQAEENIPYPDLKAGIKHSIGVPGRIDGDSCWMIPENIPFQANADNRFIYGPHSAQENMFRQTTLTAGWPLLYNINFRMKVLDEQVDPATEVCSITIKYSYSIDGIPQDTILLTGTIITAGNLTNQFQDRIFQYRIPVNLKDNPAIPMDYPEGYEDRKRGQGVQYIVERLSNVGFAIDYIEIWDGKQMIDYKLNDSIFSTNILSKASEQSTISNLEFWHGSDAPLAIDHYQPYRIVDSILTTNDYPSLITNFYPSQDNLLNGWNSMQGWVDAVHPKKFYLECYPTWCSDTPSPCDSMDRMLEYLRTRLQMTFDATADTQLNHDFYYMAPVIGYQDRPGHPYYRQPIGIEFRAMVMLALAHGAKGLFVMEYHSYWESNGSYLRTQGLVNLDGSFTDLWYYIKDNISPRINGKFRKYIT